MQGHFATGSRPFVGRFRLIVKAKSETDEGLGYTVRAVSTSSVAFGSFEELAMPLFSQLYNFACWLAGDRTAAEDLVQETYFKACKGFSSFQQGTNFRAWMYRILRNTFLTTRRSEEHT